MASDDARRMIEFAFPSPGIAAQDRGYWRWRFIVLDKHSPF